jgi:crotonobetainyl-CoA:carnitine CoA-transferase CaiB-like acyl-CoA transferase
MQTGSPKANGTRKASIRPLRGTRVLDFTAMMAGPYCARWLADLGAEVIKVEPPSGDHIRTRAPVRNGSSSFFGHFNAGKRFVELDLKNPDAVAVAQRLVEKCDIVIEAYRPGVMKRLGLGPETLRTANPKLIYCSISGFGQTSSWARRPAYAPVVHAASGFYMANFDYQDGAERPLNSGIPLADMITAVFAALSIQTAILERERTGKGATIDVNLMDSMMNVMAYEFQAAQFPMPNRRPLYKPLRARDGFVLVAPVNANNFRSVCEATGHREWLDDPLLNTDQGRFDNWAEYMRRIEEWTSQHDAEECEALFMAAGVPCSRYRRIGEAMGDAQFAERGSFANVSDDAGAFKVTNLPFSFDGVKPTAGDRVAALGADTESVLTSLLGMSADEVRTLVGKRAPVYRGQVG